MSTFDKTTLAEAIGTLADCFEYGHLKANASPVEFLEEVTEEIIRLRELTDSELCPKCKQKKDGGS